MGLKDEFEKVAQTIKEKVGEPLEVEINRTSMTMNYPRLSFSQTKTLMEICSEENLSFDMSAISHNNLFLFFSVDRI